MGWEHADAGENVHISETVMCHCWVFAAGISVAGYLLAFQLSHYQFNSIV